MCETNVGVSVKEKSKQKCHIPLISNGHKPINRGLIQKHEENTRLEHQRKCLSSGPETRNEKHSRTREGRRGSKVTERARLD